MVKVIAVSLSLFYTLNICSADDFNLNFSEELNEDIVVKPTNAYIPTTGTRPGQELSQKIESILKRTRSYQGLVDLPQREFSDLEAVKEAQGYMNGGIFLAEFQGKKVILKVEGPSELTFVKEARLMQVLNLVGLGPKFYGVTSTVFGRALVMEFVEGVVEKDLDEKIHLREQTIQSIIRAAKFLRELELSTPDLQFIIRPNGEAVVIDTGRFQSRYLTKDLDHELLTPVDPLEAAKDILLQLADPAQHASIKSLLQNLDAKVELPTARPSVVESPLTRKYMELEHFHFRAQSFRLR